MAVTEAAAQITSQFWSSVAAVAGYGAALAISLRLRPARYWLTPLIALLSVEALFGLWMLAGRGGWLPTMTGSPVARMAGSLLFGLGLWTGFEFQSRSEIAGSRPVERRINTGLYAVLPSLITLLIPCLQTPPVEAGMGFVARSPFMMYQFFVPVAAIAIQLLFFYNAWEAIQSPLSLRPGTVVAPLLVPLFSVYWLFRAVPGFATAYDRFSDYTGAGMPRLSRAPLLALAVYGACRAPFDYAWSGLVLAHMIPIQVPRVEPNFLGAILASIAVAHMANAVNRLPATPSPSASGLL